MAEGQETEAEPGVGRRTFVKGMVAGAAIGAAGAAGLAGAGWLVGRREDEGFREVRYAGAEVQVGSPTPRGVPLLPLTVDGSGYVHARPVDVRPYVCRGSAWGGSDPDYAGDDALRYAIADYTLLRVPDEAERRARWWYYDRLGERVNVAHFRDVPFGEGAWFSWRAGQDPNPFGLLLKLRREELDVEDGASGMFAASFVKDEDLVAYDAACPHFCCIAGWHEDDVAKVFDSWDMIFCTCHNARFDPRKVRSYSFTLDPRRA